MPAPTRGVVLGLDHREREVGLVVEEVVRLLGLAPLHRLATHDDPALGEVDLLADLGHQVPLVAVRSRRPMAGVMNLVRMSASRRADNAFRQHLD
jgi:Holliday junction resolvase-like predicted endonuclease